MPKGFEVQLSLGCTPIEEVKIPTKTRSHMVALVEALQYIYVRPEWNNRIFDLLSEKLLEGKQKTGRNGMSLWEVFVLAQVRLCMNISYDQLHYQANYDALLRGMLGVLPTDYSIGKQYGYQNIYDNVKLVDDELLKDINQVIVEVGHEVFKKKEGVALRLKADSFVVETDTHFPTDYNLLWDSARKCIQIASKLQVAGWRKSGSWHKELKKRMRAVGKTITSGGLNKEERLEKVRGSYLKKVRALETKVADVLINLCATATTIDHLRKQELIYYYQMLTKHIDLVDRRLIKKETIPHSEKLFSIFQPYAEWINKGKRHPSVEIGKKLFVTSDQYNLIVDWQIGQRQADNELTLSIAKRIHKKYAIQSFSVDKGFSDQADKESLEEFIPEVVMSKKGKTNKAEKAVESAPEFKKLRNKHSAIESNINELEHRGLNRCLDRTWPNFNRYVGLAITAYNLHKIGRKLLQIRVEKEKTQQAA